MSELEICKLAYEGQTGRLKTKIDENNDLIRATDSAGRIPLHWASSGGRKDIVDYLLQMGSEVDAKDDSKWTPLIIASSVGREDIVLALIEKGADVNAVNQMGQCALHYAASKNKFEVAELLLRYNANINIGDHMGSTPLHRAASKGNSKIVRLFLSQKKLDLQPQDCAGNTPLHLGCEDNQVESVLLLIEAGASLDIINKEKKTPLQLAPITLRNLIQQKQETANKLHC
ncbi:26S proteasome non-ATPase regulatory subunit 10-like [Centruroides vittatus]|uniref:26S proteasome non-ATPase regulatory subunit 10-like n=1 Tax=Centruroides vittatus TaxID=120091 RepID=UPI00350EAAA4